MLDQQLMFTILQGIDTLLKNGVLPVSDDHLEHLSQGGNILEYLIAMKNQGLDSPTYVFATEYIGSALYVGSLDGVRWSVDDARTWSAEGADGVPTTFDLIGFDERAFAATTDGVYLGSRTSRWTRASEGLPSEVIMALAVDSLRLWAGTSNGMIYSRELSTFSHVDVATSRRVATLRIEDVGPNPAANRLTLRWSAPRSTVVTITLVDVRGVAHSTSTVSARPGTNIHEVHVGALPSGVYTCFIATRESSDSRSVVIAR